MIVVASRVVSRQLHVLHAYSNDYDYHYGIFKCLVRVDVKDTRRSSRLSVKRIDQFLDEIK